MPWKILKRPCKKSDGKTGKYVIVKIKRGGGTEQSSCHTSKKKAQGGVRARHANEGKMKITKRQLRRIIKEELELVSEGDIPAWQGETGKPRDKAMTEYELYAHFEPIVKRLNQFKDDMDYAAGLTASSVDTLQLPEKLHSEINSAIFKLEDLRIKMAQHIGQDPHPHMRN